MRGLPLLILLAACSETGTLHTYPIPDLAFELTSPTYGEFVGDGPIVVAGKVGHRLATVWVEGEEVPVNEDGTFSVALPIERPYALVDVSASFFRQAAEARVPVFRGLDPLETWPGGFAARLTPTGLAGLESVVEGLAEELISAETLLAGIPPIAVDTWAFTITGVTRAPIEVDLTPGAAGLAAALTVRELRFDAEITGDIFGFPVEVPLAVLLDEVRIGATVVAGLGAEGDITLSVGEPEIDFSVPTFEFFDLDFSWLSDLLLGAIDLGALLDGAIAPLFDGLEAFSLGDALQFETDLLGTSIDVRFSEVVTDEAGIGLGLGIGLNEPAPVGGVPVPWPTGDPADPADLALAVHEGVLQLLLESDLLDLLEQDIQIPGLFGEVLGSTVRSIPGGEQAPTDTAGWCVSLQPGEAKVARFQEGTTPLLAMYLPDATVVMGYIPEPGGSCTNWLVASIALEVSFDVTEGTKLSFGIAAPEGKVLEYGAVDYDSDEVIAGLGGVLGGLLNLLGGFAEIDLADLLGGAGGDTLGLGDLALEIRGSRQMVDETGAPIPGLYDLGIDLFADAP
jgi:hypothetical protein